MIRFVESTLFINLKSKSFVMKKILIMFVTILSATLVGCVGTEKSDKNVIPEPKDTVQTIAPEDTMSVSVALVKYEVAVNKLIPALLKMQKGDRAALKEYQSLNKEVNSLIPILDKKVGELNDKDKKKYQEIAKKLYQATDPSAPAPAQKKK